MAGAQNLPVVLSRIRLAAVARKSRLVTSESDEVLAKHTRCMPRHLAVARYRRHSRSSFLDHPRAPDYLRATYPTVWPLWSTPGG